MLMPLPCDRAAAGLCAASGKRLPWIWKPLTPQATARRATVAYFELDEQATMASMWATVTQIGQTQ